jgi:hypothetical protein
MISYHCWGKTAGSYKTVVQGAVIAQNEGFDLISVFGMKAKKFVENIIHVKMTMVYSSVHDKRWEYISAPELPNGSKTTKFD